LTAQKLQNEDVPSLLKQIITPVYLQETDSEYPIVSRKPEWKKFTDNFLHFWNKFFSKCNTTILLDDVFSDAISSWLSNLTNSSARPFRHTSTLVGLEIISGIIKAAKKIHQQQQHAQKQLSTEQKKSTTSNSKIKQLSDTVDKNEETLTQLIAIVEELFLGVFFRRYRDVVPEIRIACIEALGNWINEYPRHFLQDEYLKYVAWTLNDKSPDVRKAALNALQPLYDNREYQTQLEHFTQRFRDRIVEMTSDVDNNVCIEALKLTNKLQGQGWLEQSDVDKISELIINENANVRAEAANFVKEIVFIEKSSNKKAKKK